MRITHHGSSLPVLHAPVAVSLYRGVLVQWDEDYDTRVLTMIDDLPTDVRQRLLFATEHEGSVELTWRDSVPEGFEQDNPHGIETSDGDNWVIARSHAV